MPYNAFNKTKPNPETTDVVAQTIVDARNNFLALLDASVLGISPLSPTYQTFDADGTTTPATDPVHPPIEIFADGADRWKNVTEYDPLNSNRVKTSSAYRSYDSGATWQPISTYTPTYSGTWAIVG